MGAVFRIALRNLVQHRSKTLVVGILITLGIALTFIGNSLFESSARGVKRAFTQNFTGDVMLQAKTTKHYSIFGLDSFSLGPSADPVPVLPHYIELTRFVEKLPQLESWTSQVSGFGFINLGKNGQAFSLLFGVDPDRYFSTFHALKIVAGHLLKKGETGILMSQRRVEEIAKTNHVQLHVGDQVLLNSFSKAGLKIRSVPLVGIYEYTIPTQALEVLSYVDAQTLRALNAMSLGTFAGNKPPKSVEKLLDASSDAAFFSDAASALSTLNASTSTAATLAPPPPVAVPDAWNNLLIRLKPQSDPEQVIKNLNEEFQKRGWAVQAVGWKEAAGTTAKLTGVTQFVFNLVLVILAFVAIIIIINTLVLSVMERTPEIGTMRAMGAEKSFIRSLFVTETLAIAGIFGLLGILIGCAGVLILGNTGIVIDNDFLQILFGARDLRPRLSWSQVEMALGLTLGIGLVSWIYPVSLALKVSPLKAINTD
jgi:putative ABC transport system permease protein